MNVRDAQLEAARRIAGYINAKKEVNHHKVGDGNYALIALYDNGDRALAFVGFASAFDAELFVSYLGQFTPKETSGMTNFPSISRLMFGMEESEPPKPSRKLVRYDVVALVSAVSDEAFNAISGGFQ
jgi:hypothetical protein